ncbi:MAG: hypothetical protein V2B19_12260 [Pseudomonadota bacterium]
MISTMDEYLIHQTESTVDHVASTDVAWQDRFYFNFHNRQGTFAATLGYGVLPNTNRAEGFFRALHGNKIYAVNFNRPLNHDREVVRAGGLAVEVVEPLKRWHLTFNERSMDISFDLEFTGRSFPYEFRPIFYRRNGRTVWNQVHYTQAGSYSDGITIGGETIKDLIGIRDRSWGIRDIPQIALWIWISVNFNDQWLTVWHSEDAKGKVISSDGAISVDGRTDKTIVKIVEDQITFDAGSRIPKRSTFILDAEGKRMELQAQPISNLCFSFAPGVIDLSDPDQREPLEKGVPIFSQVQEFRLGNEIGYGITEYLVAGGCERYKGHWAPMSFPDIGAGFPDKKKR